jgi:hypothetical protein
VKFAIILSCLISASLIGAYSIVMSQVKAMESFYGNMDKYVSESLSTSNSIEHPYTPQPLTDMSQPIKNNTSFLGN